MNYETLSGATSTDQVRIRTEAVVSKYIATSKLMNLTRKITQGNGTVIFTAKIGQEKPYADELSKYIKSPLDRAWITATTDQFAVSIYMVNVLTVPTVPRAEFFETLKRTENAENFIHVLALWPAYGLFLYDVSDGIETNNFQSAIPGMTIIRPFSQKDRDNFIDIAKTFYDIAVWKALGSSARARGLLSSYDRNYIESAAATFTNTLSEMPTYLEEKPRIDIFSGGVSGGTLLMSQNTKGIPSAFAARGDDGKPRIDGPINITVAGKAMAVKNALYEMYIKAHTVFMIAKEIIIAHYGTLVDAENTIRRSGYADDPMFNMFLVWSGAKDTKDGKTLYLDIAENATPGNAAQQGKVIAVSYGPTSKNYEAVPLLTSYLKRGETGTSQMDIDRYDTKNNSNMGTLLLVAGGIAAAAIASKYA